MSLDQNLDNKSVEDGELDAISSFDDFLKELEEAEKNLHITATDAVVEIDGSFDDSPSAEFDVQETAEEFAAEEFAFETFAPVESRPMSSPKSSSPSPAPAMSAATKQQISDLHVKISMLEEERDELRKMAQRRQNDFENFRKRTERERSETFENILAKLSSKMLPVLDNLSRALDSAKTFSPEKTPEFEQFAQGILLVNQQLTDVLSEMGLQRVPSVGNPFDPYFHEAVATIETDETEPGMVMEELLPGFKIGKQVVRAAMVRVSVPLPGAAATAPSAAATAAAADDEILSLEAPASESDNTDVNE